MEENNAGAQHKRLTDWEQQTLTSQINWAQHKIRKLENVITKKHTSGSLYSEIKTSAESFYLHTTPPSNIHKRLSLSNTYQQNEHTNTHLIAGCSHIIHNNTHSSAIHTSFRCSIENTDAPSHAWQ